MVTENESPEVVAATQVSLHTDEQDQLIGMPRASSIYKACMRMHVIGTKLKRRRKEVITLRERIIFGIGNSLHSWIQNTRDIFGDKRRGWWKCLACGTVQYFGPPPQSIDYPGCPNCGANICALTYEEHAFLLEGPYPVTGHPDVFLDMGDVELYTVELKTIEGEKFSGLIVPLIEHVWQIQTYMWGLSEKPIADVKISGEKGYIVYISKKFRPGEFPVKTFTVRKDPAILKDIKAKLALYKRGMKKYPANIPPRQSVCERTPNCYQAKSCPTYSDCFSLKG